MKPAILTIILVTTVVLAHVGGWGDDDYDDYSDYMNDFYDGFESDYYYQYGEMETTCGIKRTECPKIYAGKCARALLQKQNVKGKRGKQLRNNMKEDLRNHWCCEPRHITNGNVETPCGTGLFQTAKYSCKAGYKLIPEESDKRQCKLNKKWSGKIPVCKSDCGQLQKPANGTVSLNGTSNGDTATYECNYLFKLTGGNDVRTCQNGSWTGQQAVCNLIACEELDAPTDGSVVMSGTSVTSTATYNCTDNFHLEGPNTRVCLKSGVWSGTKPTCETFDCGLPEKLFYGKAEADDGTTLDSTVTYTCNNGYLLQGAPATRRCTKDGWDGNQPCCVKDVCNQQPCQNNGTCKTKNGGGYMCTCKPGSFGTNCRETVCDAKPCKNEATCSFNADGVYSCSCKLGYTGNDCEKSVCDPSPCQNGGNCTIDDDGAPICTCKTDYSGTNCEQKNCPCGWKLYKSSCYLIPMPSTQKKSWDDAEDYCKGKGGHLVKIGDQDEMHFLHKFTSSRVRPWLGLHRVEGDFVWVSDGSVLGPESYTYWVDGEPNNYMGKEHCVASWTQFHKWADRSCTSERRPLCEKPL